MKIFRFLAVTVLTFTAASVWADGVVGTWELTSETPRGTRTNELTIHETDGAYSGTISGQRGEMAVEVINVEGDTFSFTRSVSTPNGDFQLDYAGIVDGDSISGTIRTPRGENQFTGKRLKIATE